MRLQVLVYGSVFLDVVINYEYEFLKAANNIYNGSSCPGGGGLNVAYTLSRLGVRVGLVAPLGNDLLGRSLLSYISLNGIKFLGKIVDKATTGIVVVLVHNNGERSFLVVPGKNLEIDTATAVKPLHVEKPVMVFLHGYWLETPGVSHVVEEVLRKAKQYSITTVFDPGAYNIVASNLEYLTRNILPLVDIIVPNYQEAEALAGTTNMYEAVEEIASKGPRIVVVKMGGKGSLVYVKDDGKPQKVEAEKPVKLVNTLGAGDAFDAGLIAGLLQGMSPVEAARQAARTASHVLSCTCAHCY